jgi:hypothetical protein
LQERKCVEPRGLCDRSQHAPRYRWIPRRVIGEAQRRATSRPRLSRAVASGEAPVMPVHNEGGGESAMIAAAKAQPAPKKP